MVHIWIANPQCVCVCVCGGGGGGGGGGEAFSTHAQTAILRIWQEAHAMYFYEHMHVYDGVIHDILLVVYCD